MKDNIQKLMEQNKLWAKQYEQRNPGIFDRLSKQQEPNYLWIGCSDSRVPANTIVNLDPGEVFVHRNIANLVNHSDLNALSVLEYAVKVLQVKDVILCGHYGCGGVQAAMENKEHGMVDNWIRVIKDTYRKNAAKLNEISDEKKKVDLLCELNVVEQVKNTCHTNIVQKAWSQGQELSIHGVIYGIEDGLLKDLNVTTSSIEDIESIYKIQ